MKAASATTAVSDPSTAAHDALRTLAGRRIYFAHQSVGHNILNGLEQLLEGRDTSLKIVKTRDPSSVVGPALLHFDAGRNENPSSKNVDFLRALDARGGQDHGIAMMKYCFLDVSFESNVQELFDGYRRTIAQVKANHPDLTLVHVTMPLTVDATGLRAGIKRLLGMRTARNLNLKRNQFNELVRKEFGQDIIFDIAALESTRPDGSREYATLADDTVFALVPEYSYDGGHLTADASRRFAERFLNVLVSASQR